MQSRYSRQVFFPGIGADGQARLKEGSVVVLGCGALGTVAASALARAGVGRLRIVDRDFIEFHNLQRQVLFDEDDVRQQIPKAIAAERHLSKVNSEIAIEGIVADVNHKNIEGFIEGMDVIVDGLDNLGTRYLINDAALKSGIPWVYGAAVSSYGMTMTLIPKKTPCLRCRFPEVLSSENVQTCDTAGVVNTAPLVVGSLEALEAIKLLVGAETVNAGMLELDVWTGEFQRLTLDDKPAEDCPACAGRYEFLDAKEGLRVTSLCGQNAVQIVNTTQGRPNFAQLAERYRPLGEVSFNQFMLRLSTSDFELVLFPDGRAIVKGSNDESVAKGIYAKYVGM